MARTGRHRLLGWQDSVLGANPIICGSGCNFQRFCSKAIFLGVNYKANDFMQAIHRIHRAAANTSRRYPRHPYRERRSHRRADAEVERAQRPALPYVEIIRSYGLDAELGIGEIKRSIGVQRAEWRGQRSTAVNNDAVVEAQSLAENSVDLIVLKLAVA